MMRTHEQIDRRGLEFARAIVARVDADLSRTGFERARDRCDRWLREGHRAAYAEWRRILNRPWEDVRRVLLDESPEGDRLRQSNPFCGVLTPRERWQLMKEFREHEATGA